MSTKTAKPIASFRVYFSRKRNGLYTEVLVFQNVEKMRMACRRSGHPVGKFCKGMFKPLTTSTRLIGRMFLVKGWLGTSVIAHESCHAMFQFARRKKLLDVQTGYCALDKIKGKHNLTHRTSVEEQCSYAMGYATRDIVCGLYRHKLLR